MKITSIKKVKENPDIYEVTYIEDYLIFKSYPKTKLIYKDRLGTWKLLDSDDYFGFLSSDNISTIAKHLKLNEEFKVY
jgi:hypothetical protein